MVVKKITTCVNEDLWTSAVMAKVQWSDAMTAGIKLMLGDTMVEHELMAQKAKLQGELGLINDKLEQIHNSDKKKADFEKVVINNIDLINKASTLVLEDITRLRAWTRAWINKTGEKITEDDFFKLCKRAAAGEFKEKTNNPQP